MVDADAAKPLAAKTTSEEALSNGQAASLRVVGGIDDLASSAPDSSEVKPTCLYRHFDGDGNLLWKVSG